jgi:hypothetical protein
MTCLDRAPERSHAPLPIRHTFIGPTSRKDFNMRSSVLAVSVCALLAVGSTGCDNENEEEFRAALSGANEVPPTGSAATGTATFEREDTRVQFKVEVNNLTAVTMAHIHSGAAGTNGPIRVNLFLGPTTGAVNGTLAEASFTATEVLGITYDALLAEMRAGNAYVNVHSVAFPTGEIRGQVQLD